MATNAHHYLEKADEFELMAQNAQAEATKAAYKHLAWSYRQLGIHVGRGFDIETDLDRLAERIVGGKKRS